MKNVTHNSCDVCTGGMPSVHAFYIKVGVVLHLSIGFGLLLRVLVHFLFFRVEGWAGGLGWLAGWACWARVLGWLAGLVCSSWLVWLGWLEVCWLGGLTECACDVKLVFQAHNAQKYR